MKALDTYMNYSQVKLRREKIHILNVNLEPGHESIVVKRVDTVVSLIKSIIMLNEEAYIIIWGDINGLIAKVHNKMLGEGYKTAL